MKQTRKFIKKHYVKLITISLIITLAAFALSITAEIYNQRARSLHLHNRPDNVEIDSHENYEFYLYASNSFGFIGLILLFIGYLINSVAIYAKLH